MLVAIAAGHAQLTVVVDVTGNMGVSGLHSARGQIPSTFCTCTVTVGHAARPPGAEAVTVPLMVVRGIVALVVEVWVAKVLAVVREGERWWRAREVGRALGGGG